MLMQKQKDSFYKPETQLAVATPEPHTFYPLMCDREIQKQISFVFVSYSCNLFCHVLAELDKNHFFP